ncbi:SubName: Full=Uncharacterized protein {ECO:0000313/EMBL:CCA67289.1} [Serendipita indica DSM 11827]|uniref:Hemerythrin-like domain-containing protein n=1 Tax=Serendipita indica (strain DSM 11827) TaxID=1109443 RepID=G4T7J6_SERID|nr:SubName: Full=Uncharacterized protein {ECO:0000313/EMBL:CCA67289.1} [Serendipita indica DSM 11827]CCA67289.1 hypothetical protein PIIN_01122 [Serendipita indica DSM 11827]
MSKASIEFTNACNHARALFAKYCSEPAPKDVIAKLRWEMSGVHTFLLDGVQNAYNLADTIPPNEHQNFAFYCYCITQNIDRHHHVEEEHIFPQLEPEFKTDVIDEHAAFHQTLADLDDYLRQVLGIQEQNPDMDTISPKFKKGIPYDAEKLKRYLEQLSGPLITHLEHEIEWLDPERLRACGVTPEKVKPIFAQVEQHIKESIKPQSLLVFAAYHIPPYCQFPEMPWVLLKVLVPWVFWWKHRASWKYIPDYSKAPFGALQKV